MDRKGSLCFEWFSSDLSIPSSFSLLPSLRIPHSSPCVCACIVWMSSSASTKTDQKKSSRVGPPAESKQLKEVKADKRAKQEARTEARVDFYTVGRANVLANTIDDEIAASALEPPVIDLTNPDPTGPDLSTRAGCWRGERRPSGLVLTRGHGELLLISESTVRPGEWRIKYDPPFPEGTSGPE